MLSFLPACSQWAGAMRPCGMPGGCFCCRRPWQLFLLPIKYHSCRSTASLLRPPVHDPSWDRLAAARFGGWEAQLQQLNHLKGYVLLICGGLMAEAELTLQAIHVRRGLS